MSNPPGTVRAARVTGASRPYRWWKARSLIKDNVFWGKQRLGWNFRISESKRVEDEDAREQRDAEANAVKLAAKETAVRAARDLRKARQKAAHQKAVALRAEVALQGAVSRHEKGRAEMQELCEACSKYREYGSVSLAESVGDESASAGCRRILSESRKAAQRRFAERRAARAWDPWRLCVTEKAKIGHGLLFLGSVWSCCLADEPKDIDAFDFLRGMLGPKVVVVEECVCDNAKVLVRAQCKVLSRRAFRAEWWARVDQYCLGAMSKQTVEDLLPHVRDSDPAVAAWYRCMVQGLCARFAGGRRVRCWRPSPGCGANRRRRAAGSLPYLCREGLSNSAVGMLGCGSVAPRKNHGARVLDCGGCLKSWRGKCLQKSVIACCGGDRQVRAARVFGSRAANHVGSGLCGSHRQARNFKVVREFLCEEQGYVWVYAAASQSSFLDGEVQGRWRLGSALGACVGCLLWVDSGHVVRVVHDEMLRADVAVSPAACAPWFRSCAGAPKRTKQGAHLKGKGNEVVMRGVAARQASVAGSTGRGSEVGARGDAFAAETHVGSMGVGAVPRPVAVGSVLATEAGLVSREVLRPDEDEQRQSSATLGCEEPGESLRDTGADGPDRDSGESDGEAQAHAAAMRLVSAGLAPDSDRGFDDTHSVCDRGQRGDGESSMHRRGEDDLSESEADSEASRMRTATLARVQRDSHEEEEGERRSGRLAEKEALRKQESEAYLPTHVDATKCQGLVWCKGYGRQCKFDPLPGQALCGFHSKRLAHGRLDRPLPEGILEKFRKEALKVKRPRAEQWYTRQLMWAYASALVPQRDFLHELTGEEYCLCLKKINANVAMNNLQRRMVRGAGVRSEVDRDRSNKYGSERECYNGNGGGRVFKWYTRTVFNNYLGLMGVSESSCTERQCMLALGATSDELRKYPMVTSRLKAYAGPQCYPHLDPRSADYRLDVVERSEKEGEEKEEARHVADGARTDVLDEQCWLCCDSCSRWRLVEKKCLPALVAGYPGEGFLQERESDLDWAAWLGQAGSRNETFRHAHGLPGNGLLEATSPEDVPPPPKPAVPRGRGREKRLRRADTDDTEIVVSEPVAPEAANAGGEPMWNLNPRVEFEGQEPKLQSRRVARRAGAKASGSGRASPPPARDAAEAEAEVPAMVFAEDDGGEDTDDLWCREPSEREFGSGDEAGVGGHELRVLFEDALVGLRGAGPLTEADRLEQQEAERAEGPVAAARAEVPETILDVQPLDVQKRTAAMREALVGFLVDKVQCRLPALRREISAEDGERAWRAFCKWHPGEDFGAVLQEILRRINGHEEQDDGQQGAEDEEQQKKREEAEKRKEKEKAKERRRLAEAFLRQEGHKFQLRRVRFECCMLQKSEPGEDGVLRWLPVRCTDDDDFDSLWTAYGNGEDALRGDSLVMLPVSKEAAGWQTPADMVRAHVNEDGEYVFGCFVRHARLLQGPRGRTGEEAGDDEEGVEEGEGVEVAGCRRACIDRIHAEAEKGRSAAPAKPKPRPKGRPQKRRRAEEKLVLQTAFPEATKQVEVHFARGISRTLVAKPWTLQPQAHKLEAGHGHVSEKLNYRPAVTAGSVQTAYKIVSLKRVPVRVAKYDLQLRDNALRATQAMHAILSHMCLFHCNECRERFPTFHPAYEPPPSVAKDMEILKRGAHGVAACSIEVARWDELPPLDWDDGVAPLHTGTCLRCQKDMDKQLQEQGGDMERAVIVSRRSERNHMDPCFRFPWQDFKDLFDSATMTESMLVALEHMQINFVTVARTGLRKFRKNTISFPQHIESFVVRHGMLKQYRVGERVNSVRGPGRDLERAVRKATDCSEEERQGHVIDGSGALVFPATILEVRPDQTLVLKYDHGGGEGVEKPEHVRPRVRMPHHPKDVPLHMMLRRNIGFGRDPLEGLQVRWWVVARLLHALCSFPRLGDPEWRLGGRFEEPMHKFYDPRLFDVVHSSDGPDGESPGQLPEIDAIEKGLKLHLAPKVSEGGLVREAGTAEVDQGDALGHATDVQDPSQFIAAGFDVNFVGPEGDTLASDVVGGTGDLLVEEDVFCRWLELSELRVGSAVARWWRDEVSAEEGAVDALKTADDETVVDLYARIKEEVGRRQEEEGEKRDGVVRLSAFVEWLLARVGAGLGSEYSSMPEILADQVLHELNVAASLQSLLGDDRGCMEEPVQKHEEEEDAVRMAERLVYGWPGQESEPSGVASVGRFVKSHPLDFPMGIGDLFEERPKKVSVEEWVQHLLRYWTGHFVGGLRGQRVVWSMVNALLLSEARSRGYGIYRNMLRRVGFRVQGGCVLTKRKLKELLASEDAARTLVNQLSTVGRSVRSTPMQWAFEGKKLDATVKHLSWLPPWVRPNAGKESSPGEKYVDTEDERRKTPNGEMQAGWRHVSDDVGLGRHPCAWWTLNCKYNAAYDVHRLNLESGGREALDAKAVGKDEVRFLFARDNPDLVAYLLALRTELHMRMVMPAVVPHSEREPYLAMSRAECGGSGNPHSHGFSVGATTPYMDRVRADVDGEGDEAPDLLGEEMALVEGIFAKLGEEERIEEEDLRQRVRFVLMKKFLESLRSRRDEGEGGAAAGAVARRGGEEQPAASGEGGDGGGGDDLSASAGGVGEAVGRDAEVSSDEDRGSIGVTEPSAADLLSRHVHEVLREIEERGLAVVDEEVAHDGLSLQRFYRKAPAVHRRSPLEVARAQGSGSTKDRLVAARSGGRPVGAQTGVRDARLQAKGKVVAGVQLQSDLEKKFDEFFGRMVKEWNPCYADGGEWRYKWDEEIGAYDVDVVVGGETAEEKALRAVPAASPERLNLRSLLDDVFDAESEEKKEVDVQRVRRLVAALVQRVARHTMHQKQRPKFGVHPCARGKESCPVCRYGFPHELFERGGERKMKLEKGDREGQWHARFPRNDELCCSYEEHVLLANMGNVDWRPCLNLWAVVQYVTKYATKAPKGSRKLKDVLSDAVDEVCKYVPEGEGADFLRRSIQRFFARTMGERDFHAYEAVQLGLQLPMVTPMMPVVSLNTTGARPLKTGAALKGLNADEPVHWDSRVDRFDKRLQLVRKQFAGQPEKIKEWEYKVRDVSLFEFWWKFSVYKGQLREGGRPVCLMVTPCYSADCANAEHPCHESYARTCVIAYWRHMSKTRRHEEIGKHRVEAKAADQVCWGSTAFADLPSHEGNPEADRFLGVRDLFGKFDAKGPSVQGKWGLAMMEMLVDPMLREWVPAWVVEQYERANPYFTAVLAATQKKSLRSNRELLKQTMREMIRRHQVHMKKGQKDQGGGESDSEEDGDADSEASGDVDADEDADRLAAAQHADDEDPVHGGRVPIVWDAPPQPGLGSEGGEADPDWARAGLEERASGAGPAVAAADVKLGWGAGERAGARGDERQRGVLWNPKNYPWTSEACNVHWSEYARLEKLRGEWYGRAQVGDGADRVMREELDPWQKFAYDVVFASEPDALRMMLMGSAGTGKSRTIRAFVGAMRDVVRQKRRVEIDRLRAKLEVASSNLERKNEVARLKTMIEHIREGISRKVLFGGTASDEDTESLKSAERRLRELGTVPVNAEATLGQVEKKLREELEAEEEAVRNSCLLAAPTGCASFQLKFGASTLHRLFGVPTGRYCGPWKNRQDGRCLRMKTRLTQARMFVIDEMSMVGRQMLGKIEFKVRDTLGHEGKSDGSEQFFGGKGVVLAGDPKQATPVCDEPLYKEGSYKGKAQNKPFRAEHRPPDAWSTEKIVNVAMNMRNEFKDVVMLRQVHRYAEESDEVPPEQREAYRKDAVEFPKVTRGMADCTWTESQHAWLARRNRSRLEQTAEGRKELEKFEQAPLLMDGRQDRVSGEKGAIRVNNLLLEQLSSRTGKPIAVLHARHGKPGTEEGKNMDATKMDSEEFRGMESELFMCEGARVLLTQNLWVEAGLMNGALGVLKGYMWPEGGDPNSVQSEKKRPLCVFVEFDSVNLGVDADGKPRTFFPDNPERRNWVPLFRQAVSSTVEEHVTREQFPLTLAWAVTHWKAQGMTLDKVRVHLSERTAAMPGIGFVATTRVRHPWDLVFEENLPDYEHFMKARKTKTFRERRRFELRQQARASWTLRRYGFCEADWWRPEEREAAKSLIEGLREQASAQRERLRNQGRPVDVDAWLWPGGEPNYAEALAEEVVRLAGDDPGRRETLAGVADRLLDRKHVRLMGAREKDAADALLRGAREAGGINGEIPSCEALLAQAREVAGTDSADVAWQCQIARSVSKRLERVGVWDGGVEEVLPLELQPLHMPAVQEAFGALIPEQLHPGMDEAVKRGKDVFGPMRGGSVLRMDGWQVNVRSEDALAQGRLHEEVLEFFLLVLKQICKDLGLPLAIGSKTVGLEVGRNASAERVSRVMGKWQKVWQGDEVRKKEELLLPVAVDDKDHPQDWVFVSVRSAVAGESIGEAQQLCVTLHDPAKRPSVSQRVARNLDVLLRGVGALVSGRSSADVVFQDCRGARVGSQRIVCALGLLLGRVARVAEEKALDPASDSFVPDVSHVLRAVFAFLRKEVSERGLHDVLGVLGESGMCRKVLGMFGAVPCAASAGRALGSLTCGPSAARGAPAVAQAGAARGDRVLRVATWNIAGGHKSAKAPDTWSDADQKAAVFQEVLRWEQVHKCDVVCLQECESPEACAEIGDKYAFVGSAAARANRGYVHMYVRHGVDFERCAVDASRPAVAARVKYQAAANGPSQSVVLVAVHLPTGDQAKLRRQCVEAAVRSSGEGAKEVVVLGDMNAQNEEVRGLCGKFGLREAGYQGCSWGKSSNKFYSDCSYSGPGLQYDRVLFAGSLWVEAHVIGEARRFFDGAEFCLSDHFGLLCYVDVHSAYGLRSRAGEMETRARRSRLAALKDLAVQKELVEARALLQLGREEMALARRRAAQRDQGAFQKAQQKAAKERAERRQRIKALSFGKDTLFAESVVALPAVSDGVPSAPHDVWIDDLRALPRGTWSSASHLPQKGLLNLGNTCFANAGMQVLLRVPAFVEWMDEHAKRCAQGARCVLCSLHATRLQLLAEACRAPRPIMAERLGLLDTPLVESLADGRQHCAVEFVDRLLTSIQRDEREAGRVGFWGNVQTDENVATHSERIFGFVRETRRRCTVCARACTRAWYASEHVLRVTPDQEGQDAMTTSELYLASCAPQTIDVDCQQCGVRTVHVEQARVHSAPNVLLMQVRRRPGQPRIPVYVEEQFEVPGFPSMELSGIVYHAPSNDGGHYTALCRGPQGGFWYYDDSATGQRKREDVGQIKPREVYMVAYCRRGGVAELAMPPAMDEAVNVVADEDMEAEGGAVVERAPDQADVVDLDGDIDMEAAGGDAVTAPAYAAAAAGDAAASVAAALAAPAVAAAVAGFEREQASGDGHQHRDYAARAAEQRAVEESRRGIGDVAAASRMAKRSAARAALDERQRTGRSVGEK